MNKKTLKIGKTFVTKDPWTIEYKGCGSSIVICMFEDYSKIGGVGHIMIPGKGALYNEVPMRYSDKIVKYMIDKIESFGGITRRIQVKIIGGSILFNRFPETNSIGNKIVTKIKQDLMKKQIPVVATDIGGFLGRNISFETWTGKIKIENSKKEVKEI